MSDGTQAGRGGDLAWGAAGSAPTAPHATPSSSRRAATGPSRFWDRPGRRVIGALTLTASAVAHYALAPWSLLPQHDFELRDTAGELSIPVDLLQGEVTPPPPQAEPPEVKPPPPPDPGKGHGDALDAGVPPPKADAAAPRPHADGGVAPKPKHERDASSPTSDGTPGDAGSGVHEDAAVARAGQASGVARDAVGMIGAAGSAQAGPQNVVVTINMAAIRHHPVGSRIGPFFAVIPQWDDFLTGTGIDPLRDTDWVSINGPSLIHSDRDVILVHYSASDAVVDKALDVVGRKSDHGGPYDAGVAGVKAIFGHADRADRIFMRPQAHVVAVVPPYYAATAARMLAQATIPRAPKRIAEAFRLTLIHPHGPMPAIPESVTELRLWIVPRTADGGADVYGEGDTASAAAGDDAVAVLKRVVREQNSVAVQFLTRGLLNGVELTRDGSRVLLHAPVSRDQLEVILAFAAGKMGVDIAPPDAGAAPGPR